MNAHGEAHEHEHEHNLSAPPVKPARETAPHEPAELPHLLRAAVSGRPDVIGRSGMNTLQRAVGNNAVGSVFQREADQAEGDERSSVHNVISSSGGRPLDSDTRGDMEARLGADFSDVRVHTGTDAHESARDVGARAYTVGNDVVFQRDAYEPSSPEGRTTLAHELTHVIQQRNGPVDGTQAPGGIRISDPGDRFEQEAAANAERAMSEPAPALSPSPASVADTALAAPAAVQRQAEEDQEDKEEDEESADVQGDFVQRAESDEAGEEEEEESSS